MKNGLCSVRQNYVDIFDKILDIINMQLRALQWSFN